RKLTGNPIQVADHVPVVGPHAAMSISAAGPIIYRVRSSESEGQLIWFNRSGTEMAKAGDPYQVNLGVSLSPTDASRVAYTRGSNIWLMDLSRNSPSPFTRDGGIRPTWSPDGSRIVF